MKLTCVIPAAGAAARMGSWKPALAFGNGTVLGTVASNAALAGLDAIVVSGHNHEKIPALLQESRLAGCRVVYNPRWEAGMLGSLQEGIKAATPCDGVFVLPGDMPCVGERVFRIMIAAAERDFGLGVSCTLFPADDDGPGHPVFIPQALFRSILALGRSGTLKPFLLSHAHRFVQVDDVSIHTDLDTMDEYRTALLGSSGFNPFK